MPIAAANDEGFTVGLLPLKEFRLETPPRVKVHILDPADVVNVVHVDPAAQGLALHIADQMTFVVRRIDAVVGIQQLDGQDSWILSTHRYGPGIGLRNIVDLLIGIIKDHAFEGAVMAQGDEGGSLLLPAVLCNEKSGSVVGRLGRSYIPHAHMRGNGLPHPF